MTSLATLLLITLGVIAGLMLLLWLLSLYLRDASIVDPFWGTGFAVTVCVAHAVARPDDFRPLLVTLLTTIWGLRLSLYLLVRNWGHGEDRRYQAMRKRFGPKFPLISLGYVFGLQGLIMWIVSMPTVAIQIPADPLPWSRALGVVGIALWIVGFLFESVGDYQLARFKRDPDNKGRVLNTGLWRYTRHPNYFGDFCVWWGLYIIAAAGGYWWTFFSPALMSFFLIRVSGVPMLERTITDRRPEYRQYIETTNAFFPGPPRKTAA